MRGAVILVLLAAVLAAQSTEPETKGTIRGVVKDSNGLPVASVAVEAYKAGGEPQFMRLPHGAVGMGTAPARTITDEAGKYVLTGLAPATYSLKTDRDSESMTYRRVKVDAGEEVALDIVVPAKPAISGRILDPRGHPVIGASVWLIRPEYMSGILKQAVSGPKVTSEDGSYRFDSNLEANWRYYVFVDRDVPRELDLENRKPIQAPTYYPSVARMDLATPLILQAGESRQKVDIQVAAEPFFCVGGKIQAAGDFEIREAALAGTRLVRFRGTPGEHGKYRVCGVPPGEYRLSVERAATEFTVLGADLEHVDLSADLAHLRVKTEWDDPSSLPAAPQLDERAETALRKIAAAIGMNEPATDDLIRLGARVAQGDPADTALNDALARSPYERGYLTAWFSISDFLLHVALNGAVEDEEAVLSVAVPSDTSLSPGLPPGDYAIEFQTLGKITTYAKEMTYNDIKIADGILRLAPGSAGTLHLVMATDVATVAVTVKDALDNPVSGASVVLIPESVTTAPALSRLAVRGQADQNGSYTSPSLAPGKYRVLATTQTIRWDVPEDLDKVVLAAFQAKSVDVAPKSKAAVTVESSLVY